ncbi:MAG: hypothetical protein AB1432_11745 [Bacteroidota bacterium]
MKNILVCKNCTADNPLFAYTCKKCYAFLRAKIPNIDFWNILALLLESPVRATENIIQSDHKNYIITLSIILGIKISINAWVINNALLLSNTIANNFVISIVIGLCGFLLGIAFVSLLAVYTAKFLNIQTRFKDFFSIYIYSFIPVVVLFVFITPIQIALFGTYWFTFNPSPFIIKNIPSYIITVIEGVFFLWSFFLTIIVNYTQIRKILFAFCFSIIQLIIIGFIIFLSLYLFHIMN